MNLAVLVNPLGEINKGKESDRFADEEVYHTAETIKRSIINSGHKSEIVYFGPEKLPYLANFDAIFNLAETNIGSAFTDYKITELLEKNKILFTGNGSYSLKNCNDKALTKKILVKNNIPTPRFAVFNDAKKIKLSFGFPVIAKPANEDASVGISFDSFLKNKKALSTKVKELLALYKQPVLVEEYIDGREVDVSIVGDGQIAKVLGISELVYNFPPDVPRIQCFEVKWDKNSRFYKTCNVDSPAKLTGSLSKKIEEISLKAYKLLKCKGYSRIDIRIRDNIPYILEINPNPCLGNMDNTFINAANSKGMDYDNLINSLVMMAVINKKKK